MPHEPFEMQIRQIAKEHLKPHQADIYLSYTFEAESAYKIASRLKRSDSYVNHELAEAGRIVMFHLAERRRLELVSTQIEDTERGEPPLSFEITIAHGSEVQTVIDSVQRKVVGK